MKTNGLLCLAVGCISFTSNAGRLHEAAKLGNLNLVHTCLSEQENPDVVDNEGWAPLHHAIWQGHEEIVTTLVESGADIQIPLVKGSKLLPVVRGVSSSGAITVTDLTPYELALRAGNQAIIAMINHVATKSCMQKLASFPEAFVNLHKNLIASQEEQFLHREKAARNMQASIAALENLVKGVLLSAAKQGDNTLFYECRESGLSLAITDKEGLNALHISCMNGRLEFIILLLEQDMDANHQVEYEGEYHHWTPLHCACLQDNHEVIKVLLDKGALPSAKNAQGERPIKVALRINKSAQIIDMLLAFETKEKRQYIAIPCGHLHQLASPTGRIAVCPNCKEDVELWQQMF